jgi:capsid protein
VGGAKIAFTFPGEKVTLSKPSHPNSVFEAFERASLRNIASAMGMTYEQLSMDWGQVNYSSARAALLEVWRSFAARKEHFAQAFMAPIYAAWLEEAIDRGIITLPRARRISPRPRLPIAQPNGSDRDAAGSTRTRRRPLRRNDWRPACQRSSANAPSRVRITSRRFSSGRANARR